jgi:hypothetical protein
LFFGLKPVALLVLSSEIDAQMCIYDASCDTHFGFCCDIDEDASLELASKVLLFWLQICREL